MSRIIEPIPVYVVTGFLSTGKTTVLNHILSHRSGVVGRAAMEEGMTPASTPVYTLPPVTETNAAQVADSLLRQVQGKGIRELWLEANGMVPFAVLEKLFLETSLNQVFRLKKVFFVTTVPYCRQLLGKTGNAVYTQLSHADTIILLDRLPGEEAHADALAEMQVKRQLQRLCPQARFITASSLTDARTVAHEVTVRHTRTARLITAGFIAFAAGYTIICHSQASTAATWHVVSALWLATVLQAFSFLILGIACSSALQVFVPPYFLENRLRGNLAKSMAWALVGGFIFPVCDCASIPMFRSLISRRVPIPAALLFMLSGPIINPVVIISTWYAFLGMSQVAAARIILGLAVALTVSLSFRKYCGAEALTAGMPAVAVSACSSVEVGKITTRRDRVILFLEHAKNDFYRMAPYIVGASFLVALFQGYSGNLLKYYSLTGNLSMTIELMLALAFILSICSTADAMIARNLSSNVPLPGILAFLIFGPMMDLKNFLILSSLFPKPFVYRLVISLVAACFAASFMFAFATGSVVI